MKPALFIASSRESLDLADSVQENLEHVAETTIWTQNVFKLSKYNIESLIDALDNSDFGVFVFTPDDASVIRGVEKSVVRDNLLFELGLFIGKLGKDRCFIIMPRGNEDEIHLPSDLLGLIPALYESNRQDGNLAAALGPATTKISRQIRNLGKMLPLTAALPATSAAAGATVMDEGDIKALIQSWMGSRPSSLNSQVIKFSDVDRELGIPTGSTKRHIVEIARRWNYEPSQRGETTVLFSKRRTKPRVIRSSINF